MQLVKPSVEYKEEYLKALEETKNETGDTVLDKPENGESFEDFVKRLNGRAKGLYLPAGFVSESIFWLDNNEFIGRTSIRHKLTDHLLKIGGHIGYYITPSKRGMGYGKKILKLALEEAKKLGIEKILITCDITNIPSQKVIEANGGILENIVDNENNKPKKKRYWVKYGKIW